jgi:hypothetical protein
MNSTVEATGGYKLPPITENTQQTLDKGWEQTPKLEAPMLNEEKLRIDYSSNLTSYVDLKSPSCAFV